MTRKLSSLALTLAAAGLIGLGATGIAAASSDDHRYRDGYRHADYDRDDDRYEHRRGDDDDRYEYRRYKKRYHDDDDRHEYRERERGEYR